MKTPEYDADNGLDPLWWLGLDEGERVLAVENAHRRIKPWHPVPDNMHVHARMHVAVENRLALGDPPGLEKALRRLIADGLVRHSAIHAIGSVIEELTREALAAGRAIDAEECERRLAALDAADWPDGEPDKKPKKRKKTKAKKKPAAETSDDGGGGAKPETAPEAATEPD